VKLVGSLLNASKHVDFALTGQRRIRKTTTMLKVKEELQRKRIITVYVGLSVYKFSPYGFAQDVMSQKTYAYAKELGKIEKVMVTLGNIIRTLKNSRSPA
jgi:hypothetical protein